MGNRMSIYRVGRPNNVVELARRHVLVAACGRHVPKAAPAVCPSTRASCLSHHFTCKLLLLTTIYFITPMTLWHIRLIFRSENSSNKARQGAEFKTHSSSRLIRRPGFAPNVAIGSPLTFEGRNPYQLENGSFHVSQ